MLRLLSLAIAFALTPLISEAQESGSAWVGAWAHTPTAYDLTPPVSVTRADGSAALRPPNYAPAAPYRNVTVRQVTRVSAAGAALRLRLSNEFGARAIKIGGVSVALAGENGAIVSGSARAVTFGGETTISISPGAPVVSDAVLLTFPALTKFAVSIYYSDETTPPAHTLFALDGYVSDEERLAAAILPDAKPARNGNHLAQIEILAPAATRAVVAFGDSLTEGVGSTRGAFRSWPDRLAERLTATMPSAKWAVVNAGVGSNRLLRDTPSANALARFDRDVLSVPGVAAVIIMLGVNDIQYANRNAQDAVTADEMIFALSQLAQRGKVRGLRVYGGTITAFEGSPDYTPGGEAIRQKVNAWIRAGGAFDGVVDFDLATRDKANPRMLSPAFDGGGHLHLNDEGYAAMAGAVDLALFKGR